MVSNTCPSCGQPFIRTTSEPLVWCAGVVASHAYHHEGGVCVVRGKWVTAGEQPAEPAQDDAAAADDAIFGDGAPPRPWSWWTYLRHARRSMLVARRLAVKRWQDREWEQHAEGHRRICSDCGAATTPRDPVFDTCRACAREWMESK